MAYTETTTQSWGSRIMGSIKWILIGVLLFFWSFVVLYWNEGRADMSEVAKTATEIDANSVASSEYDGKLISITGELSSEELLWDNYLNAWKYIALQRSVETYAWKEKTETTTEKKTGGSEVTTKSYTYEKVWTTNPEDSSNFKQAEWHTNILSAIEWVSHRVTTATNGVYNLDMGNISLPSMKALDITKDMVIEQDWFQYNPGKFLYKTSASWSLTNPEIWDIRMSYKVLNHLPTVTVFGKLMSSSNKVVAYYDKDNNTLYRAFEWERVGAISTMKTEYTASLWILRLVWFLMMFFWLNLVFGPLSVFLDVLPILGTVSRTGIGIITFICALILSIITIIISMIIHNIFALIIVILWFAWWVVWYVKKWEEKDV